MRHQLLAPPGATIQGSNKATKLHMVMEHLRAKSTTGRVATLATGTPIANSVTEAYVLMRYMDPQVATRLVHSADERVRVDDLELGTEFLRYAARAIA